MVSCDRSVGVVFVCDSSEGVTRGWENETEGCEL